MRQVRLDQLKEGEYNSSIVLLDIQTLPEVEEVTIDGHGYPDELYIVVNFALWDDYLLNYKISSNDEQQVERFCNCFDIDNFWDTDYIECIGHDGIIRVEYFKFLSRYFPVLKFLTV